MKITEMLMEWSNQNNSEEIKQKIFVNKFINCSFRFT